MLSRWWKHRWPARVAVLLVGAVVSALALWNTEFPLGGPDRSHRAPEHEQPPSQQSNVAAQSTPGEPVLPDVKLVFPGIDSSISETTHPLILTGTIVGRNADEGVAFLGVSETNPQTYRAGAMLVNGARLTQVAKNYVVLERNGKSVRLYVKGETTPAASRGAEEILTVGGPQLQVKPAVATLSETFTDFIRPNPIFRGEALVGYEVYPGKQARPFARLGLRPGDVITAIDDTPLTDPQQSMEIFRQLTSGAALVATVRRNGKQERLALDGTVVAAEIERARNAPGAPPMT